jgi:hypothetical protein
VFYGCAEIEGRHLLLGGKRRYDGPHGVLMEDSSEAELLKAELLSRQVQVLEGTRHSSRRPLKHGAAEDRRLRRWRQVRGLLRVSLSRGYSGCRPISHGPDWWAAPYSTMEDRITIEPVYRKETTEDLTSPPRNT